ncbi:PRC-barrel domain-containing protein [Candidatus Micrarchaeota archaeon]|nr:PRC-barrel domain-containing protein [Candidatus Micrarchaeota archaeon]
MATRISQLLGMDVYTDNAQYIGKIYDVILDLQKGEIIRLTLEPIKVASKDEAKRIFREKTIMYKSVKAVEKIVIISPSVQSQPTEEVEAEPEKPLPYSYRYRKPTT